MPSGKPRPRSSCARRRPAKTPKRTLRPSLVLGLGNDALKAQSILVKCAERFGGMVYPPVYVHAGFQHLKSGHEAAIGNRRTGPAETRLGPSRPAERPVGRRSDWPQSPRALGLVARAGTRFSSAVRQPRTRVAGVVDGRPRSGRRRVASDTSIAGERPGGRRGFSFRRWRDCCAGGRR